MYIHTISDFKYFKESACLGIEMKNIERNEKSKIYVAHINNEDRILVALD